MRKPIALLALLFAGCPKAAPPAAAGPAAEPLAAETTSGTIAAAVQDTQPTSRIKPVYAGSPDTEPLATRLCDLFSLIPLQRQAACCGVPEQNASFAGECARIVSVALKGGHAKLDEGRLVACDTAYRKLLEDCDRVMSNVSPLPESCQGLFQGDLKPGDACRSELECQTGLTCVGLGPTDPGKCSRPAPAGARCHPVVDPLAAYTRQSLDDHPSCTDYCNRNQCADFLPLGASCVFDTQCGPKNRCAAKKCAAGRPTLGDPCSGAGDCPLDATCAGGKCHPRGKTGASCTSDEQCLGECDKGDGGAHCGPRCPHAFIPVFSQPQKPMKGP